MGMLILHINSVIHCLLKQAGWVGKSTFTLPVIVFVYFQKKKDHHVLIINTAPLEYGHVLLVPEVYSGIPQVGKHTLDYIHVVYWLWGSFRF